MALSASSEHREERQARSVQHLQELYTVVVGIALSLAVDRLVPAPGQEFQVHRLLLALALLATLIPLYHGGLRHLDEQYAFSDTPSAERAYGVLIDFLLLVLESCTFLALADSIGRPRVFALLFCVLLALDITWASLATRFLARRPAPTPAGRWLVIDLVTGVVLLTFLATGISTDVLWYLIPAIAFTRTAADYAWTWRFHAAAEG